MIYYLPIPILLIISFFVFRKSTHPKFLKAANFAALLIFIYFILLGLYFQNFYMGEMSGGYPSRIISVWWTRLFLFLLLPIDIIYFVKKHLARKK